MLGICFLCELKIENFNFGDFITVISAFFFSLHILAIDRFCVNQNPIVFNLWQCVYIGIFGFIFALTFEGFPNISVLFDYSKLFEASSLNGFLILAIFSSLLAFSIQVYAQQGIRPHIVSLIFLMESIFSAIFGHLIFQETLGTLSIIGALLVLTSVALIPLLTAFEKK